MIDLFPVFSTHRCVCPLGFHGRRCEKMTEVPATDLTPPQLEETFETSTNTSFNDKPTENSQTRPASSTDKAVLEEETAEPLGHISITDPPKEAEASQTAGKWPPEPPTDSPLLQFDVENET